MLACVRTCVLACAGRRPAASARLVVQVIREEEDALARVPTEPRGVAAATPHMTEEGCD